MSGSSTPGTPALLHSHGIPAPHMQPVLSLQGRRGWFSQTQPRPRHMEHFLVFNPALHESGSAAG